MISLLVKIRDALAEIDGLKVYHYWRPQLKAPYCLWQEEGEGESLHTGNHKSEQVIVGTVDYYTLNDLDPMIDTIQEKLNSVENLGWSLSSVLYEDETNLIHYTWDWQIS